MKTNITILSVLFLSYFSLAQEITVESIYEKYKNAIGGKEKVESITNIIEYTKNEGKSRLKIDTDIVNSEIEVEDNLEIIYFVDLKKNQRGALSKNGKIYRKSIDNDGRKYIESYIGNKKVIQLEVENDGTDVPISIFIGSEINPNSEVIANEIYNGEEVYIVKYEGKLFSTNMKSNITYEIFSVKTGLLVAIKQYTVYENSDDMIMITEFSDYKEVQGILIPHTTNSNITTRGKNSETNTQVKGTSIIQLNVDMEDFQKNCFKNHKNCFKQYK